MIKYNKRFFWLLALGGEGGEVSSRLFSLSQFVAYTTKNNIVTYMLIFVVISVGNRATWSFLEVSDPRR